LPEHFHTLAKVLTRFEYHKRFLFGYHGRRSDGCPQSATRVATVAGELHRASRVLTVLATVLAILFRPAFTSWMSAFLLVIHKVTL
jgi:hypothetical protein